MPIVHIICATLKEDASEEAVAHALALGRALPSAEGVWHTTLGRSVNHLVAATWLDGRDALEPFAASPVHMAFIMRGLAPCIRGMWSAAVESEAAPPATAESMWVFALQSQETLFEWQVRDLLTAVDTLPGLAAVGVTVEERERYRAGGVVCLVPGEAAPFDDALAAARAQWGELAESIVECKVEVIPLRPTTDRDSSTAHDR